MAKALSGGLVPSGAVLMTDAIYESVYHSLKRAIVHTSTFSENGLAMRAGWRRSMCSKHEEPGTARSGDGRGLRDGCAKRSPVTKW